MTTIPNLNIVVQQGSHVLKIQNAHTSLDVSRLAASDQPERESLQAGTVLRFEELERIKPVRKERAGENRNRYEGRAAGRSPGKKRHEEAAGGSVDEYV